MRVLDAAAVSAWAAACVHSLEVLRTDINGINVYPVADSDTGSNLLATLTGARDALAEAGPQQGAGAALGVLARGAVAAARGNSGVIISQVLRGFAGSAGDAAEVDGPGLAEALELADQAATGAVARPVEGTMLTVLHAVAAAVHGARGVLAEVLEAACAAASAALARTPSQLPVLARAGVVDAGGRGFVAVLDALAEVVTGVRTLPERALDAGSTPPPPAAPQAWEVMYLLDEVDERELVSLRAALSELGDSVTVAGDGAGSQAVHVHCADIGAAIEAGIALGRPRRVRVEPLFTPAPPEASPVADRTLAAVVYGEELAGLLRAEGVAVLAATAGATPSTEQLLGLINEAGAAHVTVLSGGPALTTAVDTAAGHVMAADRDVVVIPCSSPVQVLAALAVHDLTRRTNDDVVAMAEAAAATRRGELVVAQEEAITWVGLVQAGDVVGLVDGEVVLIEPSPASGDAGELSEVLTSAALAVLGRMLDAGGELVTLLTGTAAPDGLGEELGERLRSARPEVELVSYPGGQDDAVLLIGVE